MFICDCLLLIQADLSGFRDENDNEFYNDVVRFFLDFFLLLFLITVRMFCNIKLLQIRGKSVGDYAGQPLCDIFSRDEVLS